MTEKDRELEVSVAARRLGVSYSTMRRLMDNKEVKWTTRGVKKGLRVFESSLEELKRRRDQQCCNL